MRSLVTWWAKIDKLGAELNDSCGGVSSANQRVLLIENGEILHGNGLASQLPSHAAYTSNIMQLQPCAALDVSKILMVALGFKNLLSTATFP